MPALVNTTTKALLVVQQVVFDVKDPYKWVDAPADATKETYEFDGNTVVKRAKPLGGSWFVLKATIRLRLRAAALEQAADTARAALPQNLQNQWNDAVVIHNDDPQVILLLQAIGADPLVILAMDPDATLFFGGRSGPTQA